MRLAVALVAVAADQLVVEVLAARAHAAHVERELRLDHVAAALRRRRRSPPPRWAPRRSGRADLPPPAARKPASSDSLNTDIRSRREEDGQPAVGDLGGERDVLRADRGEVDGDVGAPVEDRLERLAEPGGVGPRVRDLVVVARELERLLAPPDRADDLDVFARPRERLAEGRRRASPRPPGARRHRARAGSARPTADRGSAPSSR